MLLSDANRTKETRVKQLQASKVTIVEVLRNVKAHATITIFTHELTAKGDHM